MSLIQRGRGLVKMGTAGLAQNAQLEAAENRTRQQIDDAKKAGQMQMIGQGGGVGAMYGINAARTAGTAGSAGTIAPVGQSLGGSVVGSTSAGGGVSVAQGTQAAINAPAAVAELGTIAGSSAPVSGTIFNPGTANLAGAGLGGATTTTAGATTVGTATAGTAATGTAAAGTTGAAAASTPILSTMATIAAPIAIGLGVAYLISELFD
jgi:hypothetical protein